MLLLFLGASDAWAAPSLHRDATESRDNLRVRYSVTLGFAGQDRPDLGFGGAFSASVGAQFGSPVALSYQPRIIFTAFPNRKDEWFLAWHNALLVEFTLRNLGYHLGSTTSKPKPLDIHISFGPSLDYIHYENGQLASDLPGLHLGLEAKVAFRLIGTQVSKLSALGRGPRRGLFLILTHHVTFDQKWSANGLLMLTLGWMSY